MIIQYENKFDIWAGLYFKTFQDSVVDKSISNALLFSGIMFGQKFDDVEYKYTLKSILIKFRLTSEKQNSITLFQLYLASVKGCLEATGFIVDNLFVVLKSDICEVHIIQK